MEESTCCEVAEFIAVLANPYRVRILCALSDGELSVGEIARTVNLSPAHVSSTCASSTIAATSIDAGNGNRSSTPSAIPR